MKLINILKEIQITPGGRLINHLKVVDKYREEFFNDNEVRDYLRNAGEVWSSGNGWIDSEDYEYDKAENSISVPEAFTCININTNPTLAKSIMQNEDQDGIYKIYDTPIGKLLFTL